MSDDIVKTPALRPFFGYYGGKWLAAPKYPKPQYPHIIEPFAGAAGYALRHPERQVTLCDNRPGIAGLWRYLTRVSAREVRQLPLLRPGQSLDDLKLEEGPRWLIGFWLGRGLTHPNRNPSAWMRSGKWPMCFWGEKVRERVASQVEYIRHWKVLDDYRESPDHSATWFVDPPYSNLPGRHYRTAPLDYKELGTWCRQRRGQVMVCENAGATWLPFKTFSTIRGCSGTKRTGKSVEVLWEKA